MNRELLPPLAEPSEKEAIRFGERALTYRELAAVAGRVASAVAPAGRVAVWALPSLETCAAVVGAVVAGVPVVPINPKSGERELAHILADSAPERVLAGPGVELPAALADLERVDVDADLAPAPPGPLPPDG